MAGIGTRAFGVGGIGSLLVVLALFFAPAAQAGPAWSFDPPSWDFGVVVPGTGPTPAKTFALTNTGDVELSVFVISMGGADGGRFERTRNTCGTLSPAESCEVDIIFDPSSAGPKQGQLAFASKDGLAPPATVQLSGTGAGPIVAISPDVLAFGRLDLGAGPSPAQTFTVANVGQLDLAISAISIDSWATYNYPGAAPTQFGLSGGSCAAGVPVPPGGSCTIGVAFAPTAPGYLGDRLRIADNAPGSPHVATVEGFGLPAPASLPARAAFPAPRAAILRRPQRRTRKRRASFWFRPSAAATRTVCRLDRRPARLCGSPTRYRRLRTGRHRFAVCAIDANGRSGPATVFHWRVRG